MSCIWVYFIHFSTCLVFHFMSTFSFTPLFSRLKTFRLLPFFLFVCFCRHCTNEHFYTFLLGEHVQDSFRNRSTRGNVGSCVFLSSFLLDIAKSILSGCTTAHSSLLWLCVSVSPNPHQCLVRILMFANGMVVKWHLNI